MALLDHGLYSRVRTMLPEIIKFCVVGGIGTVIDIGGAALLHGKYHVEPLAAKAISTAAATVLTYLGSRFWTFRHRENQELKREAMLFIALNLAGLLIAEIVVGFVTYALGKHSQLDYNAASLIGTGLATIFRYFAYKRWVFLAPHQPSAGAAGADVAALPDYPPWELDPAFIAAEAAANVPATAASYSSPWQPDTTPAGRREAVSAWHAQPAASVVRAAPRTSGRHRKG
jgi:putative flippase GtrA